MNCERVEWSYRLAWLPPRWTTVTYITGTTQHQAPGSRLALAPSECAHSTSHQPPATGHSSRQHWLRQQVRHTHTECGFMLNFQQWETSLAELTWRMYYFTWKSSQLFWSPWWLLLPLCTHLWNNNSTLDSPPNTPQCQVTSHPPLPGEKLGKYANWWTHLLSNP